MTSYVWTAEQRRKLGLGCTVVVDGKRSEVTREPQGAWRDGVFSFETAGMTRWSTFADPSTLKPPTFTWLRKMAKRKLGPDAQVRDLRAGPRIDVGGTTFAYFFKYEAWCARSMAARLLATLPERGAATANARTRHKGVARIRKI